jgi:lipid-binding SYLF domain-containing protein
MKKISLVVSLCLCAAVSQASSIQTLSDRATAAGAALQAIRNIPDKGIPDDLLKKATCIATIPNLKKAAFFIGGSGGKGLVSCRTPQGWSNPSYLNLSSISFGFQWGLSGTDLILVFLDQTAINTLDQNTLTLSGDASVAAGPLGRTAQAGVDYKINTGVVAYARTKGLFLGASISGADLAPNQGANRLVYGGNPTVKDLLTTTEARPNSVVAPYVAQLP